MINEIFAFVKIVLCSHAPLCLCTSCSCHWSASITVGTSSCWSSTIWCSSTIIKVIEIVEHQVHVFLFFTLQVVDDTLVFVNFDSNVGVSLSGYSSRLNELPLRILVHVITPLGSWYISNHMWSSLHILNWTTIKLLGSSTHRLVIEFSALLLKLVITYIEGVSTKAMITHSHLVSTSKLKSRMVLILIHYVILMVIVSATVDFFMSSSTKYGSIEWYMFLATWNTIISIFSASISCVVSINIVGIILVMVDVTCYDVFRVWSWLLTSSANAWTSILFIVSMVRIAISMLISWNILIVWYQRTFSHIMIIIETLSNILNLSWLQGPTLVFLIIWCSMWLLLGGSIEITWCYSKFLHVYLGVLIILTWHLMILTLSQLLLTLKSDTSFLNWEFWISTSGHLLITVVCIYLFLTWRALSIEWIYLWRLNSSLVLAIYISKLWLNILFISPMTIMSISVL